MKFLISHDMKAIRKGAFVKADASANEFVLDSDNASDISKAVITGVAEAHGFKLPNTNKLSEKVSALFTNLNKLELPTMSKKTETEIVAEVIAEGVEKGLSDDQMIVKIINQKVSFKNAARLFKAEMEKQGHRVSNKDRKEQANEILAKAKFNPKTWEDVVAVAEKVSKEIPDTNMAKAHGIIRQYAKAHKIEMPKAPKKEKGAVGGFKAEVFAWIKANPKATDKDFTKFIMEEKEKQENIVKRFLPVMQLVREVAAAK